MAYIYPATVISYKHFIEIFLLKDLVRSYEVQESDSLHLAMDIKGMHPTYLPDSYDKSQSSNDILRHFD
jgi:hypothetical protein